MTLSCIEYNGFYSYNWEYLIKQMTTILINDYSLKCSIIALILKLIKAKRKPSIKLLKINKPTLKNNPNFSIQLLHLF